MSVTVEQNEKVCVECGKESGEIFKEFKGRSFKLCICKYCNSRVDKYVEFDTVLVFLDIILHKVAAYRHVVFNITPKIHWQLGIIYLLCDTYIKWYNIKHKKSRDFGTITDFSVLEMQFYFMFILSCSEAIVFLSAIFAELWIYAALKETSGPRFRDVLRVLLLSSFGKLLAFPAVVWSQTHNAIYLSVARLFIVTSNIVALNVILKEMLAAVIIVLVGNAVLYSFISLYETFHIHEYLI
ncbi:protein ARV1-like isoform X2 [Xenia sp. Carnegie-2017]|uniref:protein ARV1-like isoform X2 n=1 Tax=Xenia sp. Carnegie-2017 TaxID=2897299 RepID=UPI001F04B67F|nr:protein ARV1-like isoform X2 [Xenia sp. Carnegie-2017]